MSKSVPVIDLRDFTSARDRFVQELGDAIRHFGFVRVKGHSVNSTITEPAYQKAREEYLNFLSSSGGEIGAEDLLFRL